MIYDKINKLYMFWYIGDVYLIVGYSIDNEMYILCIIYKYKFVNYIKKKIDVLEV